MFDTSGNLHLTQQPQWFCHLYQQHCSKNHRDRQKIELHQHQSHPAAGIIKEWETRWIRQTNSTLIQWFFKQKLHLIISIFSKFLSETRKIWQCPARKFGPIMCYYWIYCVPCVLAWLDHHHIPAHHITNQIQIPLKIKAEKKIEIQSMINFYINWISQFTTGKKKKKVVTAILFCGENSVCLLLQVERIGSVCRSQ